MEKAKELRTELDKAEDKAMTAELFIATVRKYTRAKKLTERMLNELIERIEVHQAEKVDSVQVQRLTIHYNYVGTIAPSATGNCHTNEKRSSCKLLLFSKRCELLSVWHLRSCNLLKCCNNTPTGRDDRIRRRRGKQSLSVVRPEREMSR